LGDFRRGPRGLPIVSSCCRQRKGQWGCQCGPWCGCHWQCGRGACACQWLDQRHFGDVLGGRWARNSCSPAGRFTRWDWTEEGAATCICHGLATCAIGDCIVVQREDGPSVRPKQAVIDALIRMGHSLERAVEAVAFWGLGGVLADEALCARWLALRPPGRCVGPPQCCTPKHGLNGLSASRL
jgi:hypothetical protein